ncbi:MAG TPA: PAS domain S-box protein [Rheinheimera sp.]|nr:PAS domain S-box protein [Rheinheimera sp.]
MLRPSDATNESQRLQALRQLHILDTAAETRFDDITALAKQLFDVPIALISLVDCDRQWFKSKQGLAADQTPRDISFCGHAILREGLFEICDAATDPRFADNPLVTGAPFIRFYAGQPLLTAEGFAVGTLCLIDTSPRQLSQPQRQQLALLAQLASREMQREAFRAQHLELLERQRLADAIVRLQSAFIVTQQRTNAFDALLQDLLAITNSEYGFVGEVLYDQEQPYLKTYALTNIAWDDDTQAFYQKNAPQGLEFRNLNTLFGAAMRDQQIVIANDPSTDPRRGGLPAGHPPLTAFLGLPIIYNQQMNAMIGLANKPGGYSERDVEQLQPLLACIGQLVQARRVYELTGDYQQQLNLLSLVATKTTNGVLISDTHGKALWVNPGYCQLTGYSEAELLGKVPKLFILSQLNPVEERARLAQAQANAQSLTQELAITCKDGSTRWLRNQMDPVLEQGQLRGFICISSDISAERAQQAKIRDSEQHMAAVIEATQIATWQWNVQTGETLFDERWANMLGYQLSELMPVSIETWLKFAHPDDLAHSNDILQRHFSGELPYYDVQCRMRHKAGHWVWVHDRGQVKSWDEQQQPLLMYGTHADITAQKQAEALLARQYEAMSVLAEIVTAIDADESITFSNALQQACQLLNALRAMMVEGSALGWRWLCDVGSTSATLPELAQSLDLAQQQLTDSVQVMALPEGTWLVSRVPKAGASPCLLVFQLATPSELAASDQMFVRLLSRWLGAMLERAERSEQLAKLTQQIPGMVYQFRMWPDGRCCFPYSSPGIIDIYHLTPEQVRVDASAVFDLLHPQDLYMVNMTITESLENLSVWTCQYRTLLPNGEVHWLDGTALPERLADGSTLWHGYIHDITTEKNNLLEREASEARLRSLFALSPAGIALTDYQSGRFVEVNDTLAQPTGYSIPELRQMTYQQLTPAEYRIQEHYQLEQLKTTGRYGPYETEFIRQDQSRYPVLLSGVLITDPSGKKLIWSIVEDISVRKETEKALRDAKALAEATAQTKSMFLANMSHEIRTPMNGVLGMLDLLAKSSLTAAQQEQLQVAIRSGRSLLAILNDILDFSKIEAGKITLERIPFSVPEVVDDCVKLLSQSAAEKGLDIELNLARVQHPFVIGDPVRFKQILSNLLSNAVKFTQQGHIRVDVQTKLKNHQVRIDVAVADSGIGISNAQRAQLFSAFSQADSSTTRRFGGTGLGLAISQQLCRLMHGEISVESTPGVGSVFRFHLLCKATKSIDKPKVVASAAAPQLQGAHVLVVEDNPVNLMVAQMMLQEAGLTVATATNGLEALQLLTDWPADAPSSPQLILMDCLMPQLDGFACSTAIRQGRAGAQWQQIPIVALTANALTEERQKCLDAGMDDFLSKPIQSDTLLQKLADFLHTNAANGIEASTQLPIFDQQALNEQMGVLKHMIPKLLRVFLDQTASKKAKIQQAIDDRNIAELKLIAHTLKGSSSQMKLQALREVAAQLEQLCTQTPTAPEIPRLAQRLCTVLDQTHQQISHLAQEASAPS